MSYSNNWTRSLYEVYLLEKSLEVLAKKHDVTVDALKKQLEIGIKVEHEHTEDEDKARRIALDHLDEKPDYYTKLKKAGL